MKQKCLQSSTNETKITLTTSSKHLKTYGKQPTKVFNQAKTHTKMNTTKQSKMKKNHCWIVVNKWIKKMELMQQKHSHRKILNALTK